MQGLRGITQLRWATFGAPNAVNAQPHFGCGEDLVGAHNGNIVNTVQLREQLRKEGHLIRGENDGEVLVHAVEKFYRTGLPLEDSIRRAAAMLRGDYACCLTDSRENRMYTVKMGSSLYLGVGDGFICCSSDLPSILEFTRRIVPLQDGEYVSFTPGSYEIRRLQDGATVSRQPQMSELSIEAAHKGGFPYFMLKEIHEQPEKAAALIGFLKETERTDKFMRILKESSHIFFVGSGTSFHACLTASYFFNQMGGKAVTPVIAASFIEQYGKSVGENDAVVCVSQSGETKDLINVVNYCEMVKRGKILAVVNVLGSTLTFKSRAFLPLVSDLEVSVPATKTFVNQLLVLYYLARELGGRSYPGLEEIPGLLRRSLEMSEGPCRELAERLRLWKEFYCLGYGLHYGLALEGALKMKEVTYHHCEGMYSSEFKHGPLSCVVEGYPVLFVSSPRDSRMVVSHMNEISCRGGFVTAISEECEDFRRNAHLLIPAPPSDYLLSPFACIVPLQLLAYHTATSLDLDPDFPRNISKTLTVD
jgi:glucosamine--fructose-6-phosphate aminotransferase (isomerizing)